MIMYIKWFLSSIFIGCAFSAIAKNPPELKGWTIAMSTAQTDTYVKNDSYQRDNGIRSIITQTLPKGSNQDKYVYYSRLTISDNDCQNGYGTAKVFSLSGKILFEADYVKGGGSVAAFIADVICGVNK
jgi:hypothetical protein